MEVRERGWRIVLLCIQSVKERITLICLNQGCIIPIYAVSWTCKGSGLTAILVRCVRDRISAHQQKRRTRMWIQQGCALKRMTSSSSSSSLHQHHSSIHPSVHQSVITIASFPSHRSFTIPLYFYHYASSIIILHLSSTGHFLNLTWLNKKPLLGTLKWISIC